MSLSHHRSYPNCESFFLFQAEHVPAEPCWSWPGFSLVYISLYFFEDIGEGLDIGRLCDHCFKSWLTSDFLFFLKLLTLFFPDIWLFSIFTAIFLLGFVFIYWMPSICLGYYSIFSSYWQHTCSHYQLSLVLCPSSVSCLRLEVTCSLHLAALSLHQESCFWWNFSMCVLLQAPFCILPDFFIHLDCIHDLLYSLQAFLDVHAYILLLTSSHRIGSNTCRITWWCASSLSMASATFFISPGTYADSTDIVLCSW